MTHLTTPELIRALGGADAICRDGCTCRGRYAGPERRSVHRPNIAVDVAATPFGPERLHIAPDGHVALGDPGRWACPIPDCDLFGPHELHRDSEGFEWRQA